MGKNARGTYAAAIRGTYEAATRQLRGSYIRGGATAHVTQHNLGGKTHAGRTSNMELMSVTLDTSKLSGWLNTSVSCRVTRRAMGVDMWGERRKGVGQWRCKQRAGTSHWTWGARHARDVP